MKNASFSNQIGECNFGCNANFSWNASANKCEAVILPVNFCWDIKTESSCNNANSEIAVGSVPDSSICSKRTTYFIGIDQCTNMTSCHCVWANGKCNPGVDFSAVCVNNPPVAVGECSWAVSMENKCSSSENNILIKYKANWLPAGSQTTSDKDCKDDQRIYPCVGVEKLGFFDDFGFIASLAVIAGIYSVMILRRKMQE